MDFNCHPKSKEKQKGFNNSEEQSRNERIFINDIIIIIKAWLQHQFPLFSQAIDPYWLSLLACPLNSILYLNANFYCTANTTQIEAHEKKK